MVCIQKAELSINKKKTYLSLISRELKEFQNTLVKIAKEAEEEESELKADSKWVVAELSELYNKIEKTSARILQIDI